MRNDSNVRAISRSSFHPEIAELYTEHLTLCVSRPRHGNFTRASKRMFCWKSCATRLPRFPWIPFLRSLTNSLVREGKHRLAKQMNERSAMITTGRLTLDDEEETKDGRKMPSTEQREERKPSLPFPSCVLSQVSC
jgi:hypothetical protein